VLDRVQGGRLSPLGQQVVVPTAPSQPGASFAELLAAQGITVSAHAQQRLAQSNVNVDPDRLKNAFDRAENKGSKESLVLLDDLAFVVSVKNKTVITAVDGGRARDNVFTNIDSVVIG
jgi:flagellar operon protein